MIHLPDCSVTDTHARGLRRAEDSWVSNRRTNWTSQRNPRRFGPRVRQTFADLLGQYGVGRVVLTEATKKSAQWFVASLVGNDRYRLLSFTIERTHHAAPRRKSALPWVATGHCYERFIQGWLRDGSEWARVMHDAFEGLLSATDFEIAPPSRTMSRELRWRDFGDYKVWLPQGLAVVEVPESGDAVMRTVIATDALIGPHRELWESLVQSSVKAKRFTRRSGTDWFE